MKTINDIHIKWQDLFGRIDGLETDVRNRIHVEREIVPIIFVPGIMGSRLRRSSDKEVKIWDPDDILFMVDKFGKFKVTAAMRKQLVIGFKFRRRYAEVDAYDRSHNKIFHDRKDPTRERRGWGGVLWGSYGDLLKNLQQHQWPAPLHACFEFPVHAFGYNWTASNDDAGKALTEYIAKTVREYRNGEYSRDGRNRDCNKVILVTHSMGGLVARSACMLHGAKVNVFGVIHGVQPAAGSPAAYWRMKAGFERPGGGPNKSLWDWLRNPLKMAKYKMVGHVSAVILGTNGEEVTSLLGNSPGGLELLPTKDYRDNAGNRHWLTYPSAQGEVRLPVADPYQEIYPLRDVAYRMVDPEWLDPKDEPANMDEDRPPSGGPWSKYLSYLKQAKYFHDKLQTMYHCESYQFYGTDLDSPDRVEFTREDYSHVEDGNKRSVFVNKGTFSAFVDKVDFQSGSGTEAEAIVSLLRPAGKGDGTVPESSGKTLQMGAQRTAKIGIDEGSWFEIGHQDIFGTPRAQDVVFKGVWNVMQSYIDAKVGPEN